MLQIQRDAISFQKLRDGDGQETTDVVVLVCNGWSHTNYCFANTFTHTIIKKMVAKNDFITRSVGNSVDLFTSSLLSS